MELYCFCKHLAELHTENGCPKCDCKAHRHGSWWFPNEHIEGPKGCPI